MRGGWGIQNDAPGPLLFGRFIRRRSAGDVALLSGVIAAVLIATTVLGGAPAYLRSLDRLGVEDVLRGLPPVGRNLVVTSDAIPSRLTAVDAVSVELDSTAEDTFDSLAGPARRALRSPYHVNAGAGDDAGADNRWDLTRFVLMDGLDANVTFVTGRAPRDLPVPNSTRSGLQDNSDPIAEAALPDDVARELGIKATDVLSAGVLRTGAGGSGEPFRVVITGTFDAGDVGGPFWMSLAGPMLRPAQLPGFPGAAIGLFVTENGFAAVNGQSPAQPMSAAWIIDLDSSGLQRLDDGDISDRAGAFETRVDRAVPGASVLTALDVAFESLERRTVFARIPMFLMATLLVTIVAYYLFMAAGALAARRRDEIGMLRSRGISLLQMVRLYGQEAVFLIGIPVVAGPFLALALISQAGRVPPFDGLTGGGTLPISLHIDQFLLSAVAGILAFAVLVAPAVATAAGNVVAQRRAEARPERSPFFQRYFLDAAILALAGFLVWELNARGGEVLRVNEDGALSADATVFFAPALILLGASLVFLRVFPPFARGAAWLAARVGPGWAALAFWRLSRTPFTYSAAILLLTLASGLTIVAVTLASTLRDSADERVRYEIGADLRITGAQGAASRVEDVRNAPGVVGAAAAMRVEGRLGTSGTGPQFEVLAVVPDRFAPIAWFRPDFADVDLDALMARVAVGDGAAPILLPEGATDIGMWTQTDDAIEHLFLWATIRGADGIVETLTLGPVRPGPWSFQQATLEGVAQPVELLSLKLFEPAGADRSTAGAIRFDDVTALGPEPSDRTVVENFDDLDLWTVLPTSEGFDLAFTLEQEVEPVGELPGSGVGRLVFGRGADAGVRGIYRSDTGGPLPVIVSSSFLRRTGIRVGEPFVATVSGGLTPLVAVASTGYFPTLDPGEDSGFAVMDLVGLSRFMELKGNVPGSLITELFVAVDPDRQDLAVSGVEDALTSSARIRVRRDLAGESLVDPLSVAGWRGVGLIAGGTTAVVVVLGYLTYLAAYSSRMRTEEAFVRSLGLGRFDYIRMAFIEHVFVALIGVALGTGAGLVMSRFAVDASSRTDSGDEPLPPFILNTEWLPVTFAYITLAVVAVVAIIVLARRYSGRRLHEATRLEE